MKRAISAARLTLAVRAFLLAAVVVGAPAGMATAETLPRVRVVDRMTPIVRWFPSVDADVLTTVEPGTTLEVLDKEDGWYWVITPRDAQGTRRAGWVAARRVEVVTERAASPTPEPNRRDAERLPASVPSPPASVPPPLESVPPPPASNTSVAGAASRGVTASNGTNGEAVRKEYTFEDVHFARNRYALRPEETDRLDKAANAFKDDLLLRVNVEGYTCSLGTPAYNLGLGDRRANAVKDYLMSKGVSADRLRTVSFGEEHAKHDNSREGTRRLNRRVALVPDVQP